MLQSPLRGIVAHQKRLHNKIRRLAPAPYQNALPIPLSKSIQYDVVWYYNIAQLDCISFLRTKPMLWFVVLVAWYHSGTTFWDYNIEWSPGIRVSLCISRHIAPPRAVFCKYACSHTWTPHRPWCEDLRGQRLARAHPMYVGFGPLAWAPSCLTCPVGRPRHHDWNVVWIACSLRKLDKAHGLGRQSGVDSLPLGAAEWAQLCAILAGYVLRVLHHIANMLAAAVDDQLCTRTRFAIHKSWHRCRVYNIRRSTETWQ